MINLIGLWVSYATLVITALFAGVLGYWQFIDVRPPLSISYQTTYAISKPVNNRDDARKWRAKEARPGQVLWFYQEWCLLSKAPGTIYSQMRNTSIVKYPPRHSSGVVGCFKKSWPFTVPSTSVGGVHIYEWSAVYELNPIKAVTVHGPPIYLNVTP